FPISLQALYEENTVNKRLSAYTLTELREELASAADATRQLEVKVELNKRFSVSMACIAFALIAVPMGITAHRKETSIGFALSLVIAFTYFFFIILADTFRDKAGAM